MVRHTNENSRAGNALNSLRNEAANMRPALWPTSSVDYSANPAKNESANAREAVQARWQWCLPESVRGEACSCQDSREGGFHTSSALASTVLLGHL